MSKKRLIVITFSCVRNVEIVIWIFFIEKDKLSYAFPKVNVSLFFSLETSLEFLVSLFRNSFLHLH